jgi:hypothetical protein
LFHENGRCIKILPWCHLSVFFLDRQITPFSLWFILQDVMRTLTSRKMGLCLGRSFCSFRSNSNSWKLNMRNCLELSLVRKPPRIDHSDYNAWLLKSSSLRVLSKLSEKLFFFTFLGCGSASLRKQNRPDSSLLFSSMEYLCRWILKWLTCYQKIKN